MYVTLLFDVEDLVDPRSDDSALSTARIFSEEGAPATMMIVGEKVRLWEARGRSDVIAAMREHDCGLHTNRHSIHPTVAEYLEGKGWEDGIEEVVAQEASGVEAMVRVLGRAPSCWGRGGSTWGPQVAPALKRLGIPAMVYTFTHLGSRQLPMHRFCDCLSYYWYYGGFDEAFSDAAAYEAAAAAAAEHLGQCAREGVPWVGLFVCHPTKLRAKAFWDALNFSHGLNTPRECWRLPEYRSEAEWDRAQANLRRFARMLANMPGVQLRTIAEMNRLVAPEPTTVSAAILRAQAERAARAPQIDCTEPVLSPAERLYLWALLYLNPGAEAITWRYVEGPTQEPPALPGERVLEPAQLRSAARQLCEEVGRSGRLPASLLCAQSQIGPGALYRALAAALADPSKPVRVRPGPEVPQLGEQLAQEVRQGIPGWMHKPHLDVSSHAALTRLQSWTLKPVQLLG